MVAAPVALHLDVGVPGQDADGTMRRRLVLLLLLSATVALPGGCGTGDPAPTAVVNGQTYLVTVARGIAVSEDDLKPYALVERFTFPEQFADRQAYTIRGVPGEDFLLVRAAPGQSDDAGPWGDYLALMRDASKPIPALCTWFETLPPTWC
ncbi:MAG: hypothetical protein AABZ33_12715 [Chloroflexota bacterium]